MRVVGQAAVGPHDRLGVFESTVSSSKQSASRNGMVSEHTESSESNATAKATRSGPQCSDPLSDGDLPLVARSTSLCWHDAFSCPCWTGGPTW